jgi:threonine dehydrogenase-like Zn-dependent dehydrogenase
VKAVILNDERRHELVERPDPVAAPGEVLVRPHYCGICGSDLHAAEVDLYRVGVVQGHEFSGEIVAVGAGVDGWQVGQRIVANPNGLVCGVCRFCRSGRYNLCAVATRQNPLGVAKDGGMAELVALPTPYLNALPDGMSTRDAAWIEPLAVAVRAVCTSPLRIGDTVAVIGGGPVGQLVMQVLRRAGASHVLLVEPSTFRRDMGMRLAADEAITPQELAERLASGEQREVDLVMECSGHPSAVQSGLEMVAPGGTIRLIGMSPSPPSFDGPTAMLKEVSIVGGFIYVQEFPVAIGMVARGELDVDALTTSVTPLANFAEAFEGLRQPEQSMKVLISTTTGT